MKFGKGKEFSQTYNTLVADLAQLDCVEANLFLSRFVDDEKNVSSDETMNDKKGVA